MTPLLAARSTAFRNSCPCPRRISEKYLAADFEGIKANLVQLARGGKTMEFLAESVRKRADELSETAAEVLVSEPAFAETLAKQLASSYTFVKEAGRAASGRYAANDPLRKMVEKMGAEDLFADTIGEVRAKSAGPVMDMGRAAHLLMRAMRQDPKLGNRTAIIDSLRQVELAGDPFVSGNAVEALKIFRQANQPPPPPTPQQLGQPKPSGVGAGTTNRSANSLNLSDPNHVARQHIDEASHIADRIMNLSPGVFSVTNTEALRLATSIDKALSVDPGNPNSFSLKQVRFPAGSKTMLLRRL